MEYFGEAGCDGYDADSTEEEVPVESGDEGDDGDEDEDEASEESSRSVRRRVGD